MAKNLGLLNPALTGSTISLDRRSNSSLNVIDNAMYLDVDSGNPYNTLQRNDNHLVNPRPKRTQNAVYDDIYNPRVVGQNQSRTSQTPKKPGRATQRKNGRIFRVVLMFLIVLVAIIALLLVLLLMMGKVGPKCRCRTSVKLLHRNVRVNTISGMAYYPPSVKTNWEAKQQVALPPRPRADSNSSYVVLSETAKDKHGAYSSKSSAKEKKKRRKKPKSVTGNCSRTVRTLNDGYQIKSHLEHHGCCHGLCYHRFLQFLVLFFSVAALTLVIVMVFGVLGPAQRCRACNETEGTSPKVGRQSSEEQNEQNETDTSSKNTFNMDFSPFFDILEDLQANISSLRQEAESLLQQSEGNTDTLLAAKTKFSFTRHEITQFYNTFYAVVNNVNNSLQQFSHDNGPVSGQLQALNITFTNELAEMKQTYQQYNDVIDDAIQNVNNTIAEKVSIRIAEPGPTGEKGQNGFRGPTGDTGPAGPKGPMGIQGITGAKGDKGMKGDPGFPGKNGNQGASGDKGIKGLQGDTGPPGIQGDKGDPGPRGIGNFSWCQPKIKEQTSPVSIADTQNTKVIGAYCTTTDTNAESNLDVRMQSPPNYNEYSCDCRPSGSNCALHYWSCPIHAP
ncbi:uncharacterized protein [Porites lutea]|uniref:uncharacterized protein n=1 Tax=Porites lutea TaxID=51062 RepID=UPI003CC5B974